MNNGQNPEMLRALILVRDGKDLEFIKDVVARLAETSKALSSGKKVSDAYVSQLSDDMLLYMYLFPIKAVEHVKDLNTSELFSILQGYDVAELLDETLFFYETGDLATVRGRVGNFLRSPKLSN